MKRMYGRITNHLFLSSHIIPPHIYIYIHPILLNKEAIYYAKSLKIIQKHKGFP